MSTLDKPENAEVAVSEPKAVDEGAVAEGVPVEAAAEGTPASGEVNVEGAVEGEGKKKKKEKKPKQPAPPAEPPRPLNDPTRWKMVVGEVKRVWEHENSEKLWCEEIDVGEENVRLIASGLRKFVTKEEFEGAKVIVLANLKEKPLGGFPSNGMVICASDETHEHVELLIPPPEAQIGDLVTFEGLEGEPDPILKSKKNADTVMSVMDTLKTDAECCAVAGGHKFLVRGQPVKSKTLANAHVG